MANFITQTEIQAKASIVFDEAELRALDALTGYGADSFLKMFYKHLGEAYMKPHETGLRSLFTTLNGPVHTALQNVDALRKIISESPKKPRIRVVG